MTEVKALLQLLEEEDVNGKPIAAWLSVSLRDSSHCKYACVYVCVCTYVCMYVCMYVLMHLLEEGHKPDRYFSMVLALAER